MAATGTPTPNIGLRRAQGTDPASVDDINYNSALIDTKLGAVGNSSVQDQIDTLNSNFTNLVKTYNFTLKNVEVTYDETNGWYSAEVSIPDIPSGYKVISIGAAGWIDRGTIYTLENPNKLIIMSPYSHTIGNNRSCYVVVMKESFVG